MLVFFGFAFNSRFSNRLISVVKSIYKPLVIFLNSIMMRNIYM